ncbi:hypothetical protein O3M35_003246 [Rhynocoris fuscipes]|uniref:Uncharacterized protein n=1 Tax=Rhynocoris fuscipes TaxID=488301 RepID=A0AAW1CIC0_9HEMI
MDYFKILLIVCMTTLTMAAESSTKINSDQDSSDLKTDSSVGFGYISPYGTFYSSVSGYGNNFGFGWPGYYGGYYGGYGYPWNNYGWYGGYPWHRHHHHHHHWRR